MLFWGEPVRPAETGGAACGFVNAKRPLLTTSNCPAATEAMVSEPRTVAKAEPFRPTHASNAYSAGRIAKILAWKMHGGCQPFCLDKSKRADLHSVLAGGRLYQ